MRHVILAANLLGTGGLGQYARSLADAIRAHCNLRQHQDARSLGECASASAVWVQHGWSSTGPNSFKDGLLCDAPATFNGPSVFCAGFDFRLLGDEQIANINKRFAHLWVDSAWTAYSARSAGVDRPTRALPLLVPSWPPIERTVVADDEVHRYVFLHVANGSPWVKGTDHVIAAFQAAFGNDESTRLILKLSGSAKDHQAERCKLIAEIAERPNIVIDERRVAHHEMVDVYASSHCYVHASRSDSLGMPALEAARLGLPLITHDGAAHTRDLFEGAVLFAPYQYGRFPASRYRSNHEASTIEVDVQALSEAMYTARRHFAGPTARTRLLIDPNDFANAVHSHLLSLFPD